MRYPGSSTYVDFASQGPRSEDTLQSLDAPTPAGLPAWGHAQPNGVQRRANRRMWYSLATRRPLRRHRKMDSVTKRRLRPRRMDPRSGALARVRHSASRSLSRGALEEGGFALAKQAARFVSTIQEPAGSIHNPMCAGKINDPFACLLHANLSIHMLVCFVRPSAIGVRAV